MTRSYRGVQERLIRTGQVFLHELHGVRPDRERWPCGESGVERRTPGPDGIAASRTCGSVCGAGALARGSWFTPVSCHFDYACTAARSERAPYLFGAPARWYDIA